MLPVDAVPELRIVHQQLGRIYGESKDPKHLGVALDHFREAIRYDEANGNRAGAGQSRSWAALALSNASRFSDAREWALAAIRDFEASRNPAAVMAAAEILTQIESHLPTPPRPP